VYDRKGKLMDEHDFLARFGDDEYKRVAFDTIGECDVSTVWLGLDHNFRGEGPPIIFETMVFGEGPYADYQWRYSTEEEARRGHETVVEALKGDKAAIKALDYMGLEGV
jgi:hypothetical protein